MELNNLEVEAFEVVDGGKFEDVILSGMGKIKGDVTSNIVESNGVCTVSGTIDSESLMVSGTFSADKDVNLQGIANIKGISNFGKSLNCIDLKVEGNMSAKGNVKCRNANVMGILGVKGMFTADELKLKGQIDIAGDVRVNEVDINFIEKSSVNDIIGDNVNLTTKHDDKKGLFSKLKFKTMFKCNEIKAKNVFIENTDCKIIIADSVTIGENCKVEKVEYKSKFEFDKSSEVKESICQE